MGQEIRAGDYSIYKLSVLLYNMYILFITIYRVSGLYQVLSFSGFAPTSANSMRLKALAIAASIPTMSNSISESVRLIISM